ncbi:hypothetical protein Bca52824_078447 [Brassica carinata]|uniref:C2H2-type domain-containing protein n=1 Tax=Brassica carinata TaxID=52824 RepID=A0A8X7PXM9_BRACI|nr:hypothetical protein Bca52824_078447 [Brassica carinata]
MHLILIQNSGCFTFKKQSGYGRKKFRSSRFTTKSIKNEASPGETPMCGEFTVLGTKCKHRSLPEILYCKKHRPHANIDSSSDSVKRKLIDIMSTLEDAVPLEGSVPNEATSFTEMLEHCSSNEDNLSVGSCSENIYVPCNEFSTKHTCSSREEKLPLHQACDIFYKLFKSLSSLRNSVPMEEQLEWAILTRIWGFNDESMSESIEEEKWSFSGFACAICLDSFVKRQLLEAHVEERNHVQFAEKCMLLLCIPCGSNFGVKEQLLTHVQASSQNPEAGTSQKYVCKFCGLKFNLLPDLGRHHQVEHMEPSSGRLNRPNKFKKSIGAVSYRIRNMKRKIFDAHCSVVSKILLSKIQKAKQRPSNQDILSAARSACCRLSLETSIEAKFGVLPRRIYLKAAKLCGEHGVQHWCGCRGLVCSPLTCDHVYLFGNDFEEARDVYRKSMSCSANLVTHQVVVESMESLLAHIGLYASTDIAAGEEITRDYERKPRSDNHPGDDMPGAVAVSTKPSDMMLHHASEKKKLRVIVKDPPTENVPEGKKPRIA